MYNHLDRNRFLLSIQIGFLSTGNFQFFMIYFREGNDRHIQN